MLKVNPYIYLFGLFQTEILKRQASPGMKLLTDLLNMMLWRGCLSERLQKTNGWDILSKRPLQRSNATGIRDLYGGSLFWFFFIYLSAKRISHITQCRVYSIKGPLRPLNETVNTHPRVDFVREVDALLLLSYHERNPSHSSRLIQMWNRNSVEISTPLSPTCNPPVIQLQPKPPINW